MPVNRGATRVLYRTLSCNSTAVSASIANALDNSPAFNGRHPAIRDTISLTVLVAAALSEQINTSLSTS